MRGQIFHKTQGHCAYCGRPLDPFGTWQIDHVIPSSRDGTDEISNLVASCRRCNSRKKNKTPAEFKEYLTKRALSQIDDFEDSLSDFFSIYVSEESLPEQLIDLTSRMRAIVQRTQIVFYIEANETIEKREVANE